MGYFVNNAIPWKELLLLQYNQMLVLYKINSSDLHNICLPILKVKSFSWQLSFECKKTIVSGQFPWRTAKMNQNFLLKSYAISLFPKCPVRLKDLSKNFFFHFLFHNCLCIFSPSSFTLPLSMTVFFCLSSLSASHLFKFQR